MALATRPDTARLAAPNRGALWASLALTRTQLAALCGLSLRQVSYWSAQGHLPRSTRDPDRYSGDAVDLAVLIRQGLDQGLPLRRAAAAAREYLAAENARQPDLRALDAGQLAATRGHLAHADAALRDVLAVVAPLTPREASR